MVDGGVDWRMGIGKKERDCMQSEEWWVGK